MAIKRIDKKDVTDGQPLVLPVGHPDTVFLNPNNYIQIKGTITDYSKYQLSGAYSNLSGTPENGEIPLMSSGSFLVNQLDAPQLTDIESVTYTKYYDTITKEEKIKAVLKIRNSSKNPNSVAGVDARIWDPNLFSVVSSAQVVGATFTTPTPSTPVVVFKRDTDAIAWGWNDVSGLGSYSSLRYEWIISTTSSPSATALDSGTKPYSNSGSFKIGTSVNTKQYRVSSKEGDTPATSSSRWLRVRAVVTGTDGKEYFSSYSSPL